MTLQTTAIASAIVLGAVAAYYAARFLRVVWIMARAWWRRFKVNLRQDFRRW